MVDRIEVIYSFHHNPIDPLMGAGVRTINVLNMLHRLFKSRVLLYTFGDEGREKFIDDTIFERSIKKPFLFRNIRAGYLCMFPILLSSRLNFLSPFTENSLLVFETPFMGYAVSKRLDLPKNSLKIYDAHNLEINYWRPYLQGTLRKPLIKKVKAVEKHIAEISDYILVTSDEEIQKFQEEYSVDKTKLILVPNGVDTSSVKPIPKKHSVPNELRSNYSKHVVFMGSRVKANTDAAKWIVSNLAEKMPDVCFIIVGSVCLDIVKAVDNVRCMGVLSVEKKNQILQMSDVAINPVTSGAGTSVKMLEYLSAGLPTITTTIGARGLRLTNNLEALVTDNVEQFQDLLISIFQDVETKERLAKNGRLKAREFDWRQIEYNLGNALRIQ